MPAERIINHHIEEIRREHPEAFAPIEGEAGVVLQRESISEQPSIPRPTDNITGKEIVEQSSRRPIIVRPSLEVTPKELSDHRADTHRKTAHWVSNKIAYATGAIDGITDGVINGTGELVENGAFLISKIVYGAIHGWSRGKFPGN